MEGSLPKAYESLKGKNAKVANQQPDERHLSYQPSPQMLEPAGVFAWNANVPSINDLMRGLELLCSIGKE
jgi:hypothetical protein